MTNLKEAPTSNEKYGMPMTCRIAYDDAFEITKEAKQNGMKVSAFNAILLMSGWNSWSKGQKNGNVDDENELKSDLAKAYDHIHEMADANRRDRNAFYLGFVPFVKKFVGSSLEYADYDWDNLEHLVNEYRAEIEHKHIAD